MTYPYVVTVKVTDREHERLRRHAQYCYGYEASDSVFSIKNDVIWYQCSFCFDAIEAFFDFLNGFHIFGADIRLVSVR